MSPLPPFLLLLCVLPAACAGAPPADDAATIRFAHLGREGGDAPGFEALKRGFETRNPGYEVEWHEQCPRLAPAPDPRVVFVQRGTSRGSIPPARFASELTVGDIVTLHPGERLECISPLDLLAFTTPDPLPDELPRIIRPDWDERITDTPGGCAEEEGAYRRILLTWLPPKGPYVYHSLNAHRVRITDSFSHYHPPEHGFDELYLVQMAGPQARVITSEKVERILDAEGMSAKEATTLLDQHPLAVGDLVYMPRGTMHRGTGGALVQVISVPGFRPNAEVGLDHHLRAINERFGLAGTDALPYHESASQEAVIK